MGYKILECLELIFKIKKCDLKNSKHPKFLYPIRFSYEDFIRMINQNLEII
jgi:hypothetical protein